MIIEFFGLSNSGKSVLKKKIEEKGYSVIKFERINFVKKLIFLTKSFLLHPKRNWSIYVKTNSNYPKIDNLSLSERILSFKMRNSYISSVFAKEEYMKKFKGDIYTDEYFFQSIFMILQKKTSEKEIRELLNIIPKPDFLVLFEGNKKLREKAYKKEHPFRKGTLLPGSNISPEYGRAWMESMEYNFNILKKVISSTGKTSKELSELRKVMDNINKDFKIKDNSKLKLTPIKIYKLK